MHAPVLRAASTTLMVFAMIAGPASAGAEEKRPLRSVTVSAAGQVVAEPDIARISGGVVTDGETAREALDRNSTSMKKLVEGLKAGGIEPQDIQTSSFNVEPRYTNPREGQAAVINGYRVTNRVEVTARKLDRLGEILDQLIGLGANQMGGLAFEVSKAETLKDEARAVAVANALRRAKLFASAAGAEVGEVISIAEDAAPYQPQPMTMAMRKASAEVPIERGTETLEARVTVTWALK